MFSEANFFIFFLNHCSVRTKKLHKMKLKKRRKKFWPRKHKKIFFLGLILRFSNLNVLHKGLLMQDWDLYLHLRLFVEDFVVKFSNQAFICSVSDHDIVLSSMDRIINNLGAFRIPEKILQGYIIILAICQGRFLLFCKTTKNISNIWQLKRIFKILLKSKGKLSYK